MKKRIKTQTQIRAEAMSPEACDALAAAFEGLLNVEQRLSAGVPPQPSLTDPGYGFSYSVYKAAQEAVQTAIEAVRQAAVCALGDEGGPKMEGPPELPELAAPEHEHEMDELEPQGTEIQLPALEPEAGMPQTQVLQIAKFLRATAAVLLAADSEPEFKAPARLCRALSKVTDSKDVAKALTDHMRNVGLNADWIASAYHLSDGKANQDPGEYYLLDDEDGSWSLVRRWYVDNNYEGLPENLKPEADGSNDVVHVVKTMTEDELKKWCGA